MPSDPGLPPRWPAIGAEEHLWLPSMPADGARSIVLADMDSAAERNAQQIVGNVAAMRAAFDLAGDIDETAVLALHDARSRIVSASSHANRW